MPTGHEAPHQGVQVQLRVSFAEPAEHSPEGEMIDMTEGPRGNPMPKIVAPSPQHRIQPTQQVSKRSMFRPASQRPQLADHGGQRLLGRVGVDRLLARSTTSVSALDVPAEEVEPLIDVHDPRLGHRQAQTHRREHRPCLPTMTGAEAFCRLRSYLSTARKNHPSAYQVLRMLHDSNPWTPAQPEPG